MDFLKGVNITFEPAYISLSVTTIGFLIYFFITDSDKISRYFIRKHGERSTLYHTLFNRLTGVFCFGIIPAATIIVMDIPFHKLGLNNKNMGFTFKWAIPLTLLVIILNFLSGKSTTNLKTYPQVRIPVWTLGTLLASALSWIAYLFAYEFMFRGFLLFLSFQEMGVAGAVILNTSLYSLFHLHKGAREAFGAIPLGIVFCLLCLNSGNIWIALIVHVALALSNEWISLYKHPDISLSLESTRGRYIHKSGKK